MIQIPLTPDKYQAALKHLMELRPPDLDTLHLPSEIVPGRFINSALSADFSYDGQNLNITILEKHGFAKFASDNTIKAHLEDLLTGV